MKYNIKFKTAFKKLAKKLPKNIQEDTLNIADQLQQKQVKGDILTGNWKGFLSYHFHRKPEYRIVYITYDCNENGVCRFEEEHQGQVNQCLGLMEFILIATREEMNSLYKTDKKIITNYKRK
ncbi:MAG: hypothetical protein EAZ08_12930 [Cytophagales bacterium]|nr:MAG: hypothetical protein EAZ08_12930 [Cytophagales bacterium]